MSDRACRRKIVRGKILVKGILVRFLSCVQGL